MAKIRTRCNRPVSCPISGDPQQMKQNMLPTIKDVLKHYLWVEIEEEALGTNRNEITGNVISKVAKSLTLIWKRTKIPIVGSFQIMKMICHYRDTRRKILKTPKKLRETVAKKAQFEYFCKACTKMFDIAACKCSNLFECSCVKTKKVSYNVLINSLLV